MATTAPELDLRDLEPPIPMQRTLEATACLPAGARLVTRTRFHPVHLLALLENQGFACTSIEEADNSWVNTITRLNAPA